jgi:uncharacterized SAM-binding protein YcdF (DUF218 family)
VKNPSRLFKIISVLIALSAVWVFVAPFIAEWLIVDNKLQRVDAIVVLGGSSTYIERTQLAAEQFRNGVSNKIFITDDGGFSGWSNIERRNLAFFELSKRQLIGQGVPESAIEVINPEGDGTNYEAKLIAEIAKKRGFRSVLLVTSGYHTRRAFWTFEKYFTKNEANTDIGIVSPIPGIQTPQANSWWLSIQGWNFVAGEYVKLLYYWTFL